MLKLAQTETSVYIQLSKPEFKLIAKTAANNVPDGTNVSLEWVGKLSEFSTANTKTLDDLQKQLNKVSETFKTLSSING